MKRLILTIILAAGLFQALPAQNSVPEGYILVDSLVFTPLSAVDSTLKGQSIWTAMPGSVRILQTSGTRRTVSAHIEKNARKTVQGYRIRIFFDNKQNSRGASEAALSRFKALHPGTAAYRTFSNPFFKVTVGDYRTRSEALAALQYIKPDFPSAFIVKEKLRYPAINNLKAFKVDTLKVLRPTATYLRDDK